MARAIIIICVMKRSLSILIAIAVCMQASAGGGVTKILKKIGTFIDSLSVRGVDHNYIDATEKPWQVIVKANVNQSTVKMHTSGTIDGIDYNATPYFKTAPSKYVGLWAGYRGYGLGYTVNVGDNKGSFLTFGATGGAYGANLRIHSYENYNPHFDLDSDIIPEEEKEGWRNLKLRDPIKVRTLIANAYYLFNGKYFSYAAAYDQSVLQKRSAGSLIAGAMYFYGHINYATPSNGTLIYVMHGLGRIKLWQGSVGLGYAYNWVPTRGLLVSAIAMPMVTFVNRIKGYRYSTNVTELLNDYAEEREGIEGEDRIKWWEDNLRIAPMGETVINSGVTVNFDARLSLTYNFKRYFINAYGQFNNIRYQYHGSNGRFSDWFINASFGVRL